MPIYNGRKQISDNTEWGEGGLMGGKKRLKRSKKKF